MSWKVVFSPKSRDNLETLDKGAREQILKRIKKLKEKPEHFGKPLTGIDLWVLRAGDYRIIFNLNKNKGQVEILKVGHRRDIYDKI